jgi:hypothetical protein
MILAEIEKNRDDPSSREWYPGKYVGLSAGRGEW